MKILVCCANGAGTSMMMGMKVKQAFKELGVDAKVDHTSLSEGKNTWRPYDAIFCSTAFVSNFVDAEKAGKPVIGMKNILSVEEAKEKIQEK
ncbi:MAG: PTS sugar transporter subunit IIB, partial [Peptoniphilaceae bacterium]|nr:PTS sugar transporter subunit IIB [Peptoniphilaceae bacterium]